MDLLFAFDGSARTAVTYLPKRRSLEVEPIYNPHLKPRLTALFEAVITACLWVLAAYLAAMVLVLCVLAAAAYLVPLDLPGELTDPGAFQLYAALPLLGLGFFLALPAWAAYNRRRAARKGQKKMSLETPLAVLAKAFGLEPKQLLEIRGQQVMRAGFDGHLYRYSELPLEPSGASGSPKKYALFRQK